jgi:colanic acid/amylovoran biosynthesis glycosyltransferase
MLDDEHESIRIAYLTSLYPRASDTFVRLEVQFLRAAGFDVQTYSVRRPDRSLLVGKAVEFEAKRTTFLLDRNPFRLIAAVLVTALIHPTRFLKAVILMWRTGAPGLKGRAMHAAYFVEAALLARLLRRLGVRHLHNHIGENSATVAMLASQMSGIPFSMTIHGPGIFFHPRHWALSEKIQRAVFTACISHFCASQCMTFAPTSAWKRLRVIHCCVDPTFLTASSQRIPTDPRFTFVGRLCAEKGILLLVEAIRRLQSRNIPVRLTVIGDGPLRAEIESSIAEYGLSANIELLGWQPSDVVRQCVLNSRALVLPSFAEGLPVVLMESLALHRPVITTQIAGIPELVESGVSGWLIEPGSVDALVAALQQACEASTERLAEMGRAGARRVAQQHDAHVEVAKLAECILESIENNRLTETRSSFKRMTSVSNKFGLSTATDPC